MARCGTPMGSAHWFGPVRQPNRPTGRRLSAPAHTPETLATVTGDSLDGQEGRRLRPQIFQAIELPLVLGEDVNQHVAEVKHDPAAGGAALNALRANTGFSHPLGDAAVDGA